jgi:hypothetical protein
MRRLHTVLKAGLNRGFAMPDLGHQDGKLLKSIPSLVPREDAVDFPPDFALMKAYKN